MVVDLRNLPPRMQIIFPTVRAVYDYDAVHGDELSFKEGDLLEVMETDEDDWCRGKKLDTNEVSVCTPLCLFTIRSGGVQRWGFTSEG